MKKTTLEDLQSIVTEIEKGSFERKDVKALFSDLREHLQEGDIIREIAHFIAHPRGRTKGITFTHLQKFADVFVKAAKYGGKFEVKPIGNRRGGLENRENRENRMADQSLFQGREHRHALFAQRREIAADARKGLSPHHRTETARDFLLNFDHPNVSLREGVVKRHSEVLQEGQHGILVG